MHAADEVFGWELFGQRSVRQGDWKLVWDHSAPEKRSGAGISMTSAPICPSRRICRPSNPEQLQKMLQHWERYDQETGVIY